MGSGSLTVVGTGIGLAVHLTPEARTAIERADELLHLASDPVASSWLAELHPRSRSLHHLYQPGRSRAEAYGAMVEEILRPVRKGRIVCAAFYGHPGVFVRPSHEAIRRARCEGFEARMLPAVSAEDCLFADLGIDPAEAGCVSYDATDFLVHRRAVDTSAALILWQISVIGEERYTQEPRSDRLPVLVDCLQEWYSPEHEVTVYEASPYPVTEPLIERVPLRRLADVDMTPLATLFVPPSRQPKRDPAMLERLGLTPSAG